MALLATSCTMRNKPSRLLDKGPDYLKTKTNDQIFERRRKSAVELLAASRPQYVKTPSVLDSATTPDRHFRSICHPREKPPPRSKSEFDVSKLRDLHDDDRQEAPRDEDSDSAGDPGEEATHRSGRLSAAEWRPLSPESQRHQRRGEAAALSGRRKSSGGSGSGSWSGNAEAAQAVSGGTGLTATGAPSPAADGTLSDCSEPGSGGRKSDAASPDVVAAHDERDPFSDTTAAATSTVSSAESRPATLAESSPAGQKPAPTRKPVPPPKPRSLQLHSKPTPPPKPSFLLSPGAASQQSSASATSTTPTAGASTAVIYTARPIYIDLNGSHSGHGPPGGASATATPKTPSNATAPASSSSSSSFSFATPTAASGRSISVISGRSHPCLGSASGTNASTPLTPVAAGGSGRSAHVVSAAAHGRLLSPTSGATTMSEESSDKTPTNPQGGVMTASDASSSMLALGNDSDAAEALLSPSSGRYDGHDYSEEAGIVFVNDGTASPPPPPPPPLRAAHPQHHVSSASIAAAAASACATTTASKSSTSSPGHHRASLRSSDEFMAFSSGMSPVPRSFSDIACHHSRAGSDVSSEASRASRTSRASRASAGANLEKFFNEMGMDREILDPMFQLQEQRYRGAGGVGGGGGGAGGVGFALAGGSSEQDIYESVSSLDSRDARSICSTLSRSERELVSDSESFERNQQQTSIVERNARIIKWLCSVKKAKTPATGV